MKDKKLIAVLDTGMRNQTYVVRTDSCNKKERSQQKEVVSSKQMEGNKQAELRRILEEISDY